MATIPVSCNSLLMGGKRREKAPTMPEHAGPSSMQFCHVGRGVNLPREAPLLSMLPFPLVLGKEEGPIVSFVGFGIVEGDRDPLLFLYLSCFRMKRRSV